MQTINRFFRFLCFIALVSCKQTHEDASTYGAAELLPKTEFIEMLYELQLIEAHFNLLRASADTTPIGYWPQKYAEAFARKETRRTAFDSTFRYYQLVKPAELHLIYEELTQQIANELSQKE